MERLFESSMPSGDMKMEQQKEYSASDIRKILQQLFPHRRLVLSQFTFFNQTGVAKPTGETQKRGRQCYRLEDILPIAVVLALKEEGIPLKNISDAPRIIQENAARIFATGENCLLSGHGENISLNMPGEFSVNNALESLLNGEGINKIFWCIDVGVLAIQLQKAVAGEEIEYVRRAA